MRSRRSLVATLCECANNRLSYTILFTGVPVGVISTLRILVIHLAEIAQDEHVIRDDLNRSAAITSPLDSLDNSAPHVATPVLSISGESGTAIPQ